MGHADTRLVEGVYGRLPTPDLASRMALALGKGSITGVSHDPDPAALRKLPGQPFAKARNRGLPLPNYPHRAHEVFGLIERLKGPQPGLR